jgi:CheY-like chemotaxis protein/signal recognition particle receptor subunit beta
MAFFNHATKEVAAKLVYYGPAQGGKTTNLTWIHENVSFIVKGKLLSLSTDTDRTLYFDFLPVELGMIRGMRTRLQLYTVPGQVFYEATRRMLLKGADAVVFVADSQAAMLDANIASLESLYENIKLNELDPGMPIVIQYNKRDLPNTLPVTVLNAKLNPKGLPSFESVAVKGTGVEETLKGISKLLLNSLSNYYGAPGEREAGPGGEAPPSTRTGARPAVPPRPSPGAPPLPSRVARKTPPLEAPPLPAHAAAAPPPGATVEAVVMEPLELSADLLAPGVPDGPRDPASREPAPRAEGLDPQHWIYLLDDKQQAPVSFDDLIDLVLTSIPEDTKVWRTGMASWTPATLVPEIAEQIPPPLPTFAEEEDFPDFNTVPEMLRVALIADEDATFRRLLALPLAAQGFTIHEARDGAEAWKLARERRPWLILADLGMPEIDGFEFCRRARANSLLRHTPLVFISDSDRYKDRYRALQLGADDFLSKQAPIRELLIRIQLLMTRFSDLQSAGPREGGGATALTGALEGQIAVFGAPRVLQILNQGSVTGIFTARTDAEGGDAAVLGFRDGEIISATCQEHSGPEAVYAFLAWDRGRFQFVPRDPGAGAPIAPSVEHLLLEGCRILDESRRSPEDPAPA